MPRRRERPTDPPPASTRVDELCSRFQSELASGRGPRIEAYLAEVGRRQRKALLSQILPIEVEFRYGRGEHVSAEEYRRRLPEYEDLVSTVCASVGQKAPPATARSRRTRRAAAGPPPAVAMSDVRLASMPGGLAGDESTGLGDPLAETWPFSDLPRPLVQAIRTDLVERRYARGQIIIQQGEPGQGLFLVVEGKTDVGVETDGLWHDVAPAGGAILGEMSLVTDEPCMATVMAATPVRALLLPAERFRELAARHSVLWVALSRLIAERLGRVEVDVLSGKVVQGYRIRRAVGRGGMAVVYEAEDTRARGRGRVALKMMSHRFIHDLEAQRRFEREVEICRSLDHPNITRIFECFNSFGTNFMVMEFCDGISLAEMLRHRGAPPQEQVRRIAGQLAAALAYAHGRGVCHRDLKPGNVMIDRGGRVKLMDFGLAKTAASTELTHAGDVLGTPRYMPPEQLTGKPVDHRADVFAFGCILWELLVGKPAFEGFDVLQIITAQMRWKLPPAAGIRARLDPRLHRCLRESMAREPEDRTLDLGRVAAWAGKVDPSLVSPGE